MQKNLVIVESPAKAKTIGKFLGDDYEVLSSYGHIRDLKKKEFSIDVEKDFAPKYEIPAEKKELVSHLKTEAAKASTVWLASDEDREGEAISWHLYEVLKLKPETTKRIVFHEITKTAILNAIQNPRQIDINLVNAQQARRILDRIVGFELSPILWRKVKPALSAGRVQSVAVRLVVEKEREIQAFNSESAYRVVATFLVPDENGKQVELKAELNKRLKTKAEAQALLESCRNTTFTISDKVIRPVKRSPAPPFTTSTLQQEAARKLGFPVNRTMQVAQTLYESGLITYMRTDSVDLSNFALATCKRVISEQMGDRYSHTRQFTTKTLGAQEAHEAIRPTNIGDSAITGTPQEQRLYDLIWKRTIASQMSDAELEKTTVTITGSNGDKFLATGEVITFDGFIRVYRESYDDDNVQEEESGLLPPLQKGQVLDFNDITATERFSQHPPRYTEASLVRKLEELGIGRPSTYAPIISTIQQRGYVTRENKEGEKRAYCTLLLQDAKITEKNATEIVGAEKAKLVPTDIGLVVNDFLNQFFPDILDYHFTANVEKEFDEVAEGKEKWTDILKRFYSQFHPSVEQTSAMKTEHKVGERQLGDDPKTGKPVCVKIGRFGPMIQIGSATDEEKPRFAQLPKGVSIETITLDEALEMFKLPRTLGEYEGKTVSVNTGRFGPYVHYGSLYASMPKDKNPLNISLAESIEIIKAKIEAEAKKHIKSFTEEPDLNILNGRFGPYISYKGNNYKIPKKMVPEDLDIAACMKIIEEQGEKKKEAPHRKAPAAKAATKTTAKTSAKTKKAKA